MTIAVIGATSRLGSAVAHEAAARGHQVTPPMSSDVAGSSMCSAGIHCRAPISAWPVRSRAYDRCTVVIPLATLPAHPR